MQASVGQKVFLLCLPYHYLFDSEPYVIRTLLTFVHTFKRVVFYHHFHILSTTMGHPGPTILIGLTTP